MTKKQRKEVRRALRQYDGRGKWAAVLDRVRDYYCLLYTSDAADD